MQSNEVSGSYHMEKEGLERVLEHLQQQGLTVQVLVTDRHKQINKWLRESHPAITHYYDVWHVAKGKNHAHFPCRCALHPLVLVCRFPEEATSCSKKERLRNNWKLGEKHHQSPLLVCFFHSGW